MRLFFLPIVSPVHAPLPLNASEDTVWLFQPTFINLDSFLLPGKRRLFMWKILSHSSGPSPKCLESHSLTFSFNFEQWLLSRKAVNLSSFIVFLYLSLKIHKSPKNILRLKVFIFPSKYRGSRAHWSCSLLGASSPWNRMISMLLCTDQEITWRKI